MSRDVYVCSKPLQYFNVRNIDYESTAREKVLVIIGFFRDAHSFFEKVKQLDDSWTEVLYFDSMFQFDRYLFTHPAETLFAEIDVSFIYGIFHKLSRFKRMYVFEEGFGAYRNRMDDSKGLKRKINQWTGAGDHVGYAKFLTGQYLYKPDLYRQLYPDYAKELRSFRRPFMERLREELPMFLNFSTGHEEFLTLRGKSIGIYITNHEINEKILATLEAERERFDLIYVKLHPHIQETIALKDHPVKIIQSNIMVEFLFILLLDNGNKLTIFHESSTSIIWFQNLVENRNLGKPFEEYDGVAAYIQSETL